VLNSSGGGGHARRAVGPLVYTEETSSDVRSVDASTCICRSTEFFGTGDWCG